LEESAYDAARVQLANRTTLLDKMGLKSDIAMRKDDLQNLMFEWLNEMTKQLGEQRKQIEEKLGTGSKGTFFSNFHNNCIQS
jgi:hypothetical protein